MKTFRKIDAKEEIFIHYRSMHMSEYIKIREFGEMQSNISGKVTKKSGRGRSYADYLIRLVILCETIFECKIEDLGSFESLKKIRRLEGMPGFKNYNEGEGRFPKSAIANYAAYLVYKNETMEESIGVIYRIEQVEGAYKENVIKGAKERRQRELVNNKLIYPRNTNESRLAKENANYKCELNYNHVTFITNNDGELYIEAHHLIPMAAQDYFVNTIDFADNIIALCPTCHREIHHGIERNRKEIILDLYEKRKSKYVKYGVEISKELLLNFYGISK